MNEKTCFILETQIATIDYELLQYSVHFDSVDLVLVLRSNIHGGFNHI